MANKDVHMWSRYLNNTDRQTDRQHAIS